MSRQQYQIQFNLGAKMGSSVRRAFGNANRHISSTRRRLGTIVKTAGKVSAGVAGVGTAEAQNVNFNVTQNFNGPADRQQVEQANQSAFEQFKQWYKQIQDDEERVDFA